MPELEECRHINNRSRHIIGNRRMFVSHQINISQGTNQGTADEEYQSDSLEEPVVEIPQQPLEQVVVLIPIELDIVEI